MHIRDLLAAGKTTVFFEFFPPRQAEATARLMEAVGVLEGFGPDFVSATYGAGGSRAEGNTKAVEQIGTQYAAAQCADLLHEGVAGLHFYTLNQSRPTVAILRSLVCRPRIAFDT